MNYARISLKLKEQILRFSGELSSGLPKVVRRFLREMIYGIQARQSVRLTEISRSLGDFDKEDSYEAFSSIRKRWALEEDNKFFM